jgi:hypothetical protein
LKYLSYFGIGQPRSVSATLFSKSGERVSPASGLLSRTCPEAGESP